MIDPQERTCAHCNNAKRATDDIYECRAWPPETVDAEGVEAKDGMAGRRSVLGGIGQVVSYAYQLGASRAAPKYVQKMLLWSPCPSVDDDLHIIDVCESAGVLHSISAKVSDLHNGSEALMRRLLSDMGVMGHGVE